MGSVVKSGQRLAGGYILFLKILISHSKPLGDGDKYDCDISTEDEYCYIAVKESHLAAFAIEMNYKDIEEFFSEYTDEEIRYFSSYSDYAKHIAFEYNEKEVESFIFSHNGGKLSYDEMLALEDFKSLLSSKKTE